MKRAVSLLLLLAVLCAVFSGCAAPEAGEGNLKFKETAGGYALYRYKGSSKQTEFTVPEKYNGSPVVEIMDFALANAEYLTAIHIGANIKTIGEWAFTNSQKLKEFKVSDENTAFTASGGVLYTKDMTELVAYPNGKTPLVKNAKGEVTGGAAVTLPESVREIRANAFYSCDNLYKINLNKGLLEIGNKAFIKCANLQNFNLPGTLRTIGVDAFSFCDSLTLVTIPAGVTKIGDYAFFSLYSIIKEIVIQRANADGLTLGKDWIPIEKGSVVKKAEVRYVP